MIPTAEEFRTKENLLPNLSSVKCLDGKHLNGNERIEKLMIEFAKLHVEAALKAASENSVKMSSTKDTILNAYPLTNIT